MKWLLVAFLVGCVTGAALWHAIVPTKVLVQTKADTKKIESKAKSDREKVNDAQGSDLYDLARKRLQGK